MCYLNILIDIFYRLHIVNIVNAKQSEYYWHNSICDIYYIKIITPQIILYLAMIVYTISMSFYLPHLLVYLHRLNLHSYIDPYGTIVKTTSTTKPFIKQSSYNYWNSQIHLSKRYLSGRMSKYHAAYI